MMGNIRPRLLMWSYGGVFFTLLMGLICPLSHYGGELLWFGANLTGVVGAALLSSLTAWGCMGALWLCSTRVRPWAGKLLRVIVAWGILIIAADAVVIMVFDLRFCFRDAVAFGSSAREWRSFLSTGISHMTPDFALALVLSIWTLASLPGFVWIQPRAVSNRMFAPGIAAAILCVGLGMAPASRDPVRRFAVGSIWELMIRDTIGRRYSDAFKAEVANRAAARRASVFIKSPPAEPRRPDIVLLVIESWSNYQSRFFGGRRDWTPELDGAASRGLAFTNCIANGFTTEDGLIAILTGEEPIMPATATQGVLLDCFAGFIGAERGLPRLLAPAGYKCYFFTNGPLEFSGKDRFLDSIAFDYFNDTRDPFYRHRPDGTPWPQGCFGTSDEALYARVRLTLKEVRALRESGRERGPVLAFLETTSSHLPLVCPTGPPHTEERVMRYVDRAAGEFIRWLEEDGFFKSGGLLVTVSDHRAMLPLNRDELPDFGATAPWRVPLFLLADWLPRRGSDGRFANQTDIAPTLEWLVTGSTPAAGRRGILLNPKPLESSFIGARVATDRSSAAVWDTRTGAAGTIRWNGDRSSATAGLEDALLWLTWERIQREARNRAMPDTLAPLVHARWISSPSAASARD